MEILDSFKFIVCTDGCNYTTESSHEPCDLKRKELRFNIFSVIQWYSLLRFLYENSIKIPDCYTNYKSFYDNLSDSYFCLLKRKKLNEIDNFIIRFHRKGYLKIGVTYEHPEDLGYFDCGSYIKYLTVDDKYMTVKLLFNKFMDTCDYISIYAKDNNDFISKYINIDNDCKKFIRVNNDDNNIIEPKITLCISGMSVIKHYTVNKDYGFNFSYKDKKLHNGYSNNLTVSISSDSYFNTLIKEYSNHVLTHDAINNTMSKHIVYTDDIDVIKQVLINNNKIISKIRSNVNSINSSGDSNLHRKQDLLDTLKSLKVVDNKPTL